MLKSANSDRVGSGYSRLWNPDAPGNTFVSGGPFLNSVRRLTEAPESAPGSVPFYFLGHIAPNGTRYSDPTCSMEAAETRTGFMDAKNVKVSHVDFAR